MRRTGLPVRLIDADSLVARLRETDMIGIVSEWEHTWYSASIDGMHVQDVVQLSDEDKPALVTEKVKWEPLSECSLM